MNWFKHDANASTDAKLKKVILKYGAEGYAIYFHCIELITSNVSELNITFELEHDCEIIADNLKIKGTADKAGCDRVNEIMKYLIFLKLFEEQNGRITCLKLLKRLDSSMTSNTKMRKLIATAKENHDGIMINHDGIMINHDKSCKKRREEIRKEENKEENKEEPLAIFEYFYKEYPNRVEKGKARKAFEKHIQSEKQYHDLLLSFDNYKKVKEDWKHWKLPATFINNYKDYLDIEIPKEKMSWEERKKLDQENKVDEAKVISDYKKYRSSEWTTDEIIEDVARTNNTSYEVILGIIRCLKE